MHFGAARISLNKTVSSEEFEKMITTGKNRNIKLFVDTVGSLGYLPQSAHPLAYNHRDVTPDDNGDSLFIDELKNQLSLSKSKSVTLFIHGFRVDFTYPILIAAQFALFSGLDDTFIAYSWPSTYKKTSAYMADSEVATQSGRELRHFIEYLSSQSEIEEINIIAHSAGTRLVVEALNEFSLRYHSYNSKNAQETFKMNNIILLSGDASLNRFLSLKEGDILRFCKRVTLYQSETDIPLKLSERKQKQIRIGQVFSDNIPTPEDSLFINYLCQKQEKLSFVNSTNARNAQQGYGHNFFWTSPWVSSDIIMQLKYDLDPSKRGLTLNKHWCTWEFDEEYPEKLINTSVIK